MCPEWLPRPRTAVKGELPGPAGAEFASPREVATCTFPILPSCFQPCRPRRERELDRVHSPACVWAGEGTWKGSLSSCGRGNLKGFTLPLAVGLKGELEKVHPSVAGRRTCKGSLSRLRSNWRGSLKRLTLQAWERELEKVHFPSLFLGLERELEKAHSPSGGKGT